MDRERCRSGRSGRTRNAVFRATAGGSIPSLSAFVRLVGWVAFRLSASLSLTLPAGRATNFYLRTAPQQICPPQNKKVANIRLQPNRPSGHLRRERDSNPRYSCPYTAFRVRPDRPLRHLSRSITNPSAGNSECKYSYFSQKKHFRNKKRFEFLFSPAQCISRFYCYFCEIMTHRQ